MKTIGVLDSGIGGLTFVRQMIQRQVHADFVYISDTANVPYGNRPQLWMFAQMTRMVQALSKQKVQAILMACNTATAETIDQIRQSTDIPIVGIEPYMRHCHLTPQLEQRKYALILTPATQKSSRFQTLQSQNDPDQLVQVFALPNLALLIEQLQHHPWQKLVNQIKSELAPIYDQGFTHLILGCTHYGIIGPWLESYLSLKIVDPIQPVIDHLLQVTQVEQNHPSPSTSFLYSQDQGTTWLTKSLSDFPFLQNPFL